MVTMDGKCKACPDYTRSNEDNGYTSCIIPVDTPGCDSKTYITKHGMCVDCPQENTGGNWDAKVEPGRLCV